MTKNPYDVLGVTQNASDDDIKKAYRDLTRKYHPDANVNNPLADLAEEKFKEVQEAYDVIMKAREQGGSGYGSGYGNGYGQGSYGYNGGNQSNSGTDGGKQDVEMQKAYNFINSRRYQEAANVLNSMPNRDAQWYYLSAVANSNMGNNVLARDHASQAVNMNPNEPQYRQLLNQLEWSSQRYQNNPYGGGYGSGNSSCGTGNLCCDLCIADQLCECMGGDLCSCM